MSPEQCKSDVLDRRADVFAIAIMLWELTTSTRLFRGQGEFEIMKAIVEGETPSPRTVNPDYPLELERIVMKGLARKREDRYQTAQELQLDLEAFAREQRLVVSPVGLAKYMRELFGEKIVAWLNAQKQGKLYPEAGPPPVEAEEGGLAESSYSRRGSETTGAGGSESEEDYDQAPDEVEDPALVARQKMHRNFFLGAGAICAISLLAAAVLMKKPASATVTVPVVTAIATPTAIAAPSATAALVPPAPPSAPATPTDPVAAPVAPAQPAPAPKAEIARISHHLSRVSRAPAEAKPKKPAREWNPDDPLPP